MNRKKTLILSLVSMAFSAHVYAAKEKNKSRKKTVGELLSQVSQADRGGKLAETKKTSIAIPKAQIQFQKTLSPLNMDDVKPPRSSEILQTSEQQTGDLAEYEKILDQQIDELFKLTKKYRDSANRGELWLRLAELYVEKSVLIDNRQQEQFDRQLKAFRQGKTKQKPRLNSEGSRAYNQKSVQLYEWFLRDFPTDPKVPQAYFFLGYNYFEMGDTKKGANYYEILAKKYPRSPFVGEARFALGEFYFDNDKWAKAYEEYSDLIKDKKHHLHNFASYKGAWCLYRLGKHSEALKYLEYIIRSGQNDSSSAGMTRKIVNKSRLESEALRDIVPFYAAVGPADNAAEYFRNLIGKDEWSHVEKLAYFTYDKGNKDYAQRLFKQLISQNPTNPKAFDYQYQIVQANFYAKNTTRFRDEIQRWIKDYGVQSSWYQSNQGNQDLINNSNKLREQTLRNWTLQQHQTAQNSRTENSRKLAEDGYRLYIQEFTSSPTFADMHFYYGELLYDKKDYDEAGIQYKWVVENAPQSKFANQAARNLLHSVEKSLPSDKELQRRVGANTDPIAFDPKSQRFADAAKWYLEKYPQAEKAVEVKFRLGRLYYQHNQFDEANVIFKEIVQKYPRNKFSEYSANLMLDIYNLKKDYIGLEKAGTELLASPSLQGTKTGEEIKNVLEKASFKKAQDLEGNKNYSESAVQYEAFAKQNPKSDLALSALFNAGVNYERAGQNDKAMANYQVVLKGNDKALKGKSKKLLAKLYQNAALFEESALLFKEVANENPDDPLQSNYIYNSAIMYEALGKYREALSAYENYLKKAKRGAEKSEVLYSMAQIYRQLNQRSASVEKFEEYIDSNPSEYENVIEAHYWLSQLVRVPSEAKEWKEKTIIVQKRLAQKKKNVGVKYAARLRLDDANQTFQKLRSVKIPANPANQKKAVDEKLEHLNNLTKELTEVVKLDSGEEIVSALHLLGEANLHMAQAVLNAPLPKGLNANEEKQYREGIAKIAEPFNLKARDSFKLAVDRGIELEVYNSSYESAYTYMNKYDAKNYYNHGEYGSDTRFVNWIAQ